MLGGRRGHDGGVDEVEAVLEAASARQEAVDASGLREPRRVRVDDDDLDARQAPEDRTCFDPQ